VEVTVPNSSGPPEKGELRFIDNNVDPTTGTIRMRAFFDNHSGALWPGLFVNTVVTLSEQSDATVVPSQAITAGQGGSFVYVLREDSTVVARPVTSSRSLDGFTIIANGLQAGETVVTDGQVRLASGAKVEVKNAVKE
jgi:multidrug efflux system membrane fusion protein